VQGGLQAIPTTLPQPCLRPLVSVVATYRRHDLLRSTLTILKNTYQPYEVIRIKREEAPLNGFWGIRRPMRCVLPPGRGISRQRETRGSPEPCEIILFCDDDIIPAPPGLRLTSDSMLTRHQPSPWREGPQESKVDRSVRRPG
jgi:hypothetical protein